MRSSFRVLSRFALLASVGVAQLIACSSDSRDPSAEEVGTGSLRLPLTATAASGNLYRLRNASFEVRNIRSGEQVAFLFSENDPDGAILTQILNTGDYDITLFPGWFMERVISSGGGGTGGTSAGGATSMGGAISGGKGGITGGKGGVAGSVGFGGFPGEAGAFGVGGDSGIGGDSGFGGITEPPTKGGSTSTTGGVGSGGGERTVIVNAQLLSDAIQPFSIFSRGDSFVTYSFQIGGDIVDFNQGRLNVTIDVTEAEPQCDTPPGVTRSERVLLENDSSALGNIRLIDVFNALASNGGFAGDGFRLFQEVYDSYASPENAVLADAIHCGDEMTNGQPSLNGFPIRCDRSEAGHVNGIDQFFATAIVNRFDLAPANGANCGQQRMVFASPFNPNRAFMIIEAVVPNPAPELGIQGCMPLAKFWMEQNDIDDPFVRGDRLTQAFLTGHPDLVAAGFGPFYTATNLTVGSGQIRTNQFDDFPWTLREFKLALDGEQLKVVPFPTAEAPNGALWDDTSSLAQGPGCRENFLTAMQGLLTDDLAQMSFVVDQACRDAESQNDFSQDYSSRMSDGFRATLAANLEGTNFSPDDIANRARFAGSCIGCHNESSGAFLGNGQVAPFSNDFVHVGEFATSDCGKRNPGEFCFPLSPALTDLFLPSRLQTLTSTLGVPIVPDPCQGGGGGSGGTGGAFGSGGRATSFGGATGTVTRTGTGTGTATRTGSRTGVMTSTSTGTGTATDPGMDPSVPAPAPEVIYELPQASEPLSDLIQKDEEVRALSGDVTISGRSAQVTH